MDILLSIVIAALAATACGVGACVLLHGGVTQLLRGAEKSEAHCGDISVTGKADRKRKAIALLVSAVGCGFLMFLLASLLP